MISMMLASLLTCDEARQHIQYMSRSQGLSDVQIEEIAEQIMNAAPKTCNNPLEEDYLKHPHHEYYIHHI